MYWIIGAIAILAVIITVLLFRQLRKPKGSTPSTKAGPIDPALAKEVVRAYRSRKIRDMAAALEYRCDPLDRHFLLTILVQETYKRRDDPVMLALCERTGWLHLEEYPTLLKAFPLDKDHPEEMKKNLYSVSTFEMLAQVLVKREEFGKAAEVFEKALSLGFEDHEREFLQHIRRLQRKQHKLDHRKKLVEEAGRDRKKIFVDDDDDNDDDDD